MRVLLSAIFAGFLDSLPLAALAADSDADEFSGTPAVILPSGMIMVDGHDVNLWGIEPLASDQQCWRDKIAWDCGEQAMMALRHHLAGYQVRCEVKSDLGGEPIVPRNVSARPARTKTTSRNGW